MNCMKCGRETKGNEAFCETCLAEMAKYPVRPGVVVQIPTQPPKKQIHHRRGIISYEEQVRQLKRRNRGLVLLSILMVAVSLFFGLLTMDILESVEVQKMLGQNYNVVSSDTTNAP